MRKIKIGVWIDESYRPIAGGGFGYYSQLITALKDYVFANTEIVFVSTKFSNDWDNVENKISIAPKSSFKTKYYSITRSILSRCYQLLNLLFVNPDNRNTTPLKRWTHKQSMDILKRSIDVIYYPTPECRVDDFPYIYTLWDLGHLITYSFPEVSMHGNFEIRNERTVNEIKKALMVFCESTSGKKDAIRYLNLPDERIRVVPIFPSGIINDNVSSRKPDAIKSDTLFIHYPAQFWAHKNHFLLLHAFKRVLKRFPDLRLILTGSDKGNKSYVLQVIEEMGLALSVNILGFVSNEELKWIYQNSQGLVMPTFFGPTNMPLLEAAELECPVACSDLPGHREQMGDYAFYFDPRNLEEIETSIISMIDLRKSGVKRRYNSEFNIKNALREIDRAFTELRAIRFSWGENDNIF